MGAGHSMPALPEESGCVSAAHGIAALKWVRLSAAQGHPGAESACQFVALGMTWEEVAEGGRRAAAFVAG